MADDRICNMPVDLGRDLQGAWSTSIVTPRDPSDTENRDRYARICVEMMKWILEKKFSDPILSRALLCISTIPMPCSHVGACEEHGDEDSSGETCYKAQYKKCLAVLGDRVLEYEKIREQISATKTSEEAAMLKEANLMDPHLDIMLEVVKPYNELGPDAQITKFITHMNTPDMLAIRRKLQDLYGFAPRAMLYTLKGKEMIEQGKWCIAAKQRRETIHGDTYKRHPWATDKKPAQVKLQPVPSIRADVTASAFLIPAIDAEPLSAHIYESFHGNPSASQTAVLPILGVNSAHVPGKQRQTPSNKPEVGSPMDVGGYEIVRGPKKGKQPTASTTVTPSKPRRSLLCMTMEEQVEILFSGQQKQAASDHKAAATFEQDGGDTVSVIRDEEPSPMPDSTKGSHGPDNTGQQPDRLAEDQRVETGILEKDDFDCKLDRRNPVVSNDTGLEENLDSTKSLQRHAIHRENRCPSPAESVRTGNPSHLIAFIDNPTEGDKNRPENMLADSRPNVEPQKGSSANISEEPVQLDPTHDQNGNRPYDSLDANIQPVDPLALDTSTMETTERLSMVGMDQSRQQDIGNPVNESKPGIPMKIATNNMPPHQLPGDRTTLISVHAGCPGKPENNLILNTIKADSGPFPANTTRVAIEEPRGRESLLRGRKRSREEPKSDEKLAGRDVVEMPSACKHIHTGQLISANADLTNSKYPVLPDVAAAASVPSPPSAAAPSAGSSQQPCAAASVENVSRADLSVVTEADLEHFYQEPRQYLNLFSKGEIYTTDFLRQTILPQNAAVIVRFQRNDPSLVKHLCSSRVAEGIFEIPLEILEKGVDRKKQKVAGWESLPKEQQQGLFEAVAYLKLTVIPQRQWQKVKKVRPLTFQ